MLLGPSVTVGRAGVLRPQDVFAPVIFNTAGAGTQLGSGIDIAGSGGLLITRLRTVGSEWGWIDTARGISLALDSSVTAAEAGKAFVSSTNSNGFVSGAYLGAGGTPAVAYPIRQARNFFAIVPYLGDGTSGRQIAHSLGIAPGMVIVKRRDSADIWAVYHRSLADPVTQLLVLNTTGAAVGNGSFFGANPSASTFTVGTNNNASGSLYIAYLFAHDPDPATGIVQCGSSSSNGSGVFTIPHGWANGAQFILYKRTNNIGEWYLFDTARTPGFVGSDAFLRPNSSQQEFQQEYLSQSDGIITVIDGNSSSSFVWIAVRAPIL